MDHKNTNQCAFLVTTVNRNAVGLLKHMSLLPGLRCYVPGRHVTLCDDILDEIQLRRPFVDLTPAASQISNMEWLSNRTVKGRIERSKKGRKITDVAREFDIAQALFHGCGSHLKLLECVVDGTGRSCYLYDACRRQIYRPISKRNRRTTAQQVANQFLAASGKKISRKTVARRLRGGGLYARRPVVCVPLTRQHRTARLQWCREHHNWTEQDWACVLFSDESRFSLSSDCRRQLIWRDSGTFIVQKISRRKDRYPTCSIMVRAGIMFNGRTRLHVVANGTMTGQRYIDEVLLPHVRLSRGAIGDKFVFMDDNATCHQTLAVQDCLDSEGIQHLSYGQRVLQI
ncbi:transposable element Tcb2 transposase [Trichonephila clavipes]|nr:transposable element Tcb2 transposase [Trichonephila clavipes]